MPIEQELVRELLSKILQSKPDIKSSDYKWLIATLKDLYNPKREFQHSECIKEINGLAHCLAWGIVDIIRNYANDELDNDTAKELITKLINEYGQQEEVSRWCIESWCIQLGKKINLDNIRNITNNDFSNSDNPANPSYPEQQFRQLVEETFNNVYVDAITKFDLTIKGKRIGLSDIQIKTIIESFANSEYIKTEVSNTPGPITSTSLKVETNESRCWRMYGYDALHTRRAQVNGPITNSLNWKCAIRDSIYSSPVIGSDGSIYVGSKDGVLYSLTYNGKQKWAFNIGDSIYTSPAIGVDGIIYITSRDGKIYAINPNGKLKWYYQTGWSIDSSPTVGNDGSVYVGNIDKKLYSIDSNGKLKWIYKANGYIDSSPAIDGNGVIYFGSRDGKIYAINPNGAQKWSFQTKGFIHSSPAIGADNTIYIGSQDNNLYAIRPNGTLKWTLNTNGYVQSSPAIGLNGNIYVCSQDGKLYAINQQGHIAWTFNPTIWVGRELVSVNLTASPAIGANGFIYVISETLVYALDPLGRSIWYFYAQSVIGSSPVLGIDGSVIIGTHDGILYAIGPGSK